MWESFQATKGGVLVVGHGTRVAEGVHQLVDLASQLQSHFGIVPTEPGFLELAKPTISEAMSRLRFRGVRRVLVVPILLFEAAHAQLDIPEAVKRSAEAESISIFAQSPPLGTADAALSLSELRFVEALSCRNPAGCLVAGACKIPATPGEYQCAAERIALDLRSFESTLSHEKSQKIGLAMVGRGTSDQTALDHMRRFTALRVATSKIPISWVQTGFFAGGEPTIDQLLENAAISDCNTLVIQPHLLFEGELIRQLRDKVELYQQITPDRRWLLTPTLGADPHLASAFYALAKQSLKEFL